MKILRVAGTLYPHDMGGIGIHVHDLSTEQVEAGHEVTVFTTLSSLKTGEGYQNVLYKHINIHPPVTIIGNPIAIQLLPKLFSQVSKYDIVHAHGYDFFSTLLCAVTRVFKKFNFVITIHGIDAMGKGAQTGPTWFSEFYLKTFGKFVLSKADKIITYTLPEKKFMTDLGINPNNIQIIHNGIHCEKFQPERPVEKKKQIFWIGRCVPGKGCQYLINGFAEFSEKHPDYQLLLIGNGYYKNELLNLIRRLNLENKVTFLDSIPNNQVRDRYYESTIYVLPSLSEGVPRVVLEAMCCGLPVISSELPQIVDIINDCGLIVPYCDSHTIAEALDHLVSNPLILKQFGENARNKILSNYDWNDSSRKTTIFFQEIVDNKS